MSDVFFFAVGMTLKCIGLLLLTAKIRTYICCTVPINATVIELKKEYTYFHGIKYTHYRPIVGYDVDGKKYTEKAYFRTYRKTKYSINSEIKICYNLSNPEKIRFIGHLFPLPIGLVFLFIGTVLVVCCFL